MKKQKRIFLFTLAFALLAPTMASLAGCGSDNSLAQEDPKVTAARVEAATNLRSFYDKCKGNYDQLSDADKASVNAITGGEAKTKEAFGKMLPDRRPTAPGAPPAAPSGSGLQDHGPNNTGN